MNIADNKITYTDHTGASGEGYLLDVSEWREIRRSQGKDAGKPFIGPKSGKLNLPNDCIDVELRIYRKIKTDTVSLIQKLAKELGLDEKSSVYVELMRMSTEKNKV